MPPQKFEHVLQSVIDIAPDITESLLALVDVPMKIKRDAAAGRDYLLSEFNRDNDSFRSPWTNTYDPPCEDAVYPSERLRQIEIDANNAFDQYREMYVAPETILLMPYGTFLLMGNLQLSREIPA
ncbi:unnamed protein product [Dibothriocephalus latus]|uniref:F-actin-capping protein subunit beta n=1 Tax=Dibothriocephalus latus TaxID=60516 RepID=A0A3P7LNU5_DIBLA|nr:unnamed protein product [Dibothriocephalus latus]